MYRFLLSPRWIGFALFVVVMTAVCVQMGMWQFAKLDTREAQNKVVTRHFSQAPVALETVIKPGDKVTKATEWTRVSITGTYDPSHEVTVKFVTRDGSPGADVVTPLVTDDGQAVLINRGWTATTNNVTKPDVPAAAEGTVQVEGWLRRDTGAGRTATEPQDGQIRAISSQVLAETLPYPVMGGYVNLQDQTPAAEGNLAPEPKPELGQGPHFWYALQWWFFALIAVVGYVWFAIAESRERRGIATRRQAKLIKSA